MKSITLASAVAIAAIAMLVLLPSSMGEEGEEKKCLKGKSECTDETACVFLKKGHSVCRPYAKDGEKCNYKKGNKKGQFFKAPPCEEGLVCQPAKNNKFHGLCAQE